MNDVIEIAVSTEALHDCVTVASTVIKTWKTVYKYIPFPISVKVSLFCVCVTPPHTRAERSQSNNSLRCADVKPKRHKVRTKYQLLMNMGDLATVEACSCWSQPEHQQLSCSHCLPLPPPCYLVCIIHDACCCDGINQITTVIMVIKNSDTTSNRLEIFHGLLWYW